MNLAQYKTKGIEEIDGYNLEAVETQLRAVCSILPVEKVKILHTAIEEGKIGGVNFYIDECGAGCVLAHLSNCQDGSDDNKFYELRKIADNSTGNTYKSYTIGDNDASVREYMGVTVYLEDFVSNIDEGETPAQDDDGYDYDEDGSQRKLEFLLAVLDDILGSAELVLAQ